VVSSYGGQSSIRVRTNGRAGFRRRQGLPLDSSSSISTGPSSAVSTSPTPRRWSTELEGLSCGYDSGAPAVGDAYESPFSFTGSIHEVVVDVEGELIEDEEATLRRLMAHQGEQRSAR
jgi:hypothetical protein